MSLSTTVYPVEDFVKAAIAKPSDYLTFEVVPVPDGKKFKATFFEQKGRMDPNSKFVKHQVYGRGAIIVRGPYDPATHPADNANDKTVNFDISGNNSGAYLEFVKMYNDERDKQVKALKGKGVPLKIATEKFLPMVSEVYGDKCHADVVGQPFKDPNDPSKTDTRIKIKLDFSVWAGEKLSADIKGKPKTIVENFLTGKLDDKGQVVYEPLLYNGKPIDETNAHLALGRSTVIEEYYISLERSSLSNFGFTTSQLATRIVVTPAEKPERKIEVKQNVDLLEKIKMKQVAAKAASERDLAILNEAIAVTSTTSTKAAPAVETASTPTPTLSDVETVLNRALNLKEEIANPIDDSQLSIINGI